MANIPEELFDRLFAAMREHGDEISNRPLAAIGAALGGGAIKAQAECCPRCGTILRLRQNIPLHLAKVVAEWLQERTSMSNKTGTTLPPLSSMKAERHFLFSIPQRRKQVSPFMIEKRKSHVSKSGNFLHIKAEAGFP
jgi:hypothetical protein